MILNGCMDLRAISNKTHLTLEQLEDSRFQIFKRCKIQGKTFSSELYTRQKKRTNFHVQWKENETVSFGTIKYYLKFQGNLYAVLRQLVVSNEKNQEIRNREIEFNLNRNIKHIRDTYCIHVIPVKQIQSKVLRVENYVCIFLNNTERK